MGCIYLIFTLIIQITQTCKENGEDTEQTVAVELSESILFANKTLLNVMYGFVSN